MSEEEKETAQSDVFNFPAGIGIVDVEFPEKGKVSSGEARIFFYPNGYSDKALIHVETAETSFSTFLVEPFLRQIKTFNTYWEFKS